MNIPKTNKVVAMIPTYNEKENIQALIHEILDLDIDYDLSILVVDDNSPDGTGELVKKIAENNNRVQVCIRKKKRGRGAAGIQGFKEALKLNPEYVIEMDGDFSHQPQFIPLLLSNCKTHDLVIGSRFIKGGKDFHRNFIRKCITLLARNFIRYKFKIPIRDVSSGFRCFKREALEKLDLDDFISIGPSIVLEMLNKAFLMNFKIKEVPIIFIDRSRGKTKLNLLILMETLVMALQIKKRQSESDRKQHLKN